MDGDVFSAAVLEKLPLADSVWRLLHFTMDDSWLEDLWQRQRGRCYERDLKFSTLAHLIADALLEHSGSGNQAFERAAGSGGFAGFDHLGLRQAGESAPGGQRDPARGRHPEDERGPARDPGR